MKKIIVVLMALLMFTACSSESGSLSLYADSETSAVIEAQNADTDMESSISLEITENDALEVDANLEEGIIRLSFYEGEDTDGEPVEFTNIGSNDSVIVYLPVGSFTMDVTIEEKATGTVEVTYVAADDGQNPVMNFVGTYVAGRAAIEVTASDDEVANFSITWANSAAEVAEWTMSGFLNTETLTVDYYDAVKKTVTYAEDGSVASEETEYTDGTGKFTFNEDGTLTWASNDEDVASDTVFEYVTVNQ